MERTQGRTLPPCKAVAATRHPRPAQQDIPLPEHTLSQVLPLCPRPAEQLSPHTHTMAELQKLSAHVKAQPRSHHSTETPERGQCHTTASLPITVAKGSKGCVGGAPQTQGAALLSNLRTRKAEARVQRVSEGKGRKSLRPKDKGREARLAPACKDSPAAGNLHNILCKLISD